MPNYTAPLDDMLFLFEKLRDNKNYNEIEKYNEVNSDLVKDILGEAAKISENLILPLALSGDENPAKLENGVVRTPPGYKEAYNKYIEDGWISLSCDPKYGGQGMPKTVSAFFDEMLSSASLSFKLYSELTIGAYNCLLRHAPDEMKDKYLPKMVEGKWSGTMCLTEPVCGTDLGMLKTKAVEQKDGTFKISGQKIFITSGDHDLTENIIHLVIARASDSPAGTKGISLFLVPKYIVKEDGSIGPRNGVSAGSVEHKMGIKGSATCVLNFDEAVGYMIGPKNKGLSCMFTMMNEARHAVGMQGLSQAEIAYQYATQFSKERIQGTPLKNNIQNSIAEPTIICHPDVRRMLLDQKSFIEGARAFAIWSSILIDDANHSSDEDAKGLVSLLIPIFKAFLSDKGFEYTVLAQQVLGGAGYIEDSQMSQFVRDSRIAMIYEGTNGIQAIDLVARKLSASGGKYLMSLITEINEFINDSQNNETLLNEFILPLKSAVTDLESSIDYFLNNGLTEPNNALAGATDFLHLFGHVILGYLWSQIAKKALLKLNENSDVGFFEAKLITGKFYMKRSLPETKVRLARVLAGQNSVMELNQDLF